MGRGHRHPKVKRAVLPLLLVLLCLAAACTPSPSPTLSVDDLGDPGRWMERAGLPRSVAIRRALSPDGRWLVDNILVEADQIAVRPTGEREKELQADLDPALGGYLGLGPWAPDSSAVVFYAADEGYAHCPFERIIIFRLDEKRRTVRSYIYAPELAGLSPCPVAVWAPDSERLAVALNHKEIVLLDPQARPLRELRPFHETDAHISGLWWNRLGLFLHIEGAAGHELWALDPDRARDPSRVYRGDSPLQVLGVDPRQPRLLIGEQETGFPPPERTRLRVVDAHTG